MQTPYRTSRCRVRLALAAAAMLVVAVSGSEMPTLGTPLACASWPPYEAERLETYGDYTVCVWKSLDEAAPGFYRVVTIDRGDTRLVCEDWATGLGPLSGVDIERNGHPNVIIESYSGGAHCCFSTEVYDLGETLVPIGLPPSPGGNAPGEFVDLNGDGIYEFVSADDSFAYAYCCFAASPAVLVVLGYCAAEQRYGPVSSEYPALYCDEIARDTARAEVALAGGVDGGWDGTGKCEILPLVLDYLYSGDPDSAWAALERFYPSSDRDAFRAEIEDVVNASPYYAPAASVVGGRPPLP